MDVTSETWSFGDSPQFFKTLFWRLENAPPGHNSPVVRKPTQDGATWPVLFERLQQLDQLFQAWHDQLRGLFVCHGQQKDQDEAATAQRKRGKSLDETASEDGYSSGEDGPGERSTLRGLSTSTNQARPRSKTLSDCHLEANCTRKPPVPIATNSQVARPPAMHLCIMIVGTRGDVQPFLAIAKRLQHDGHRVRLATHKIYRDLVTSHGVEFYPLGGDPKELAARPAHYNGDDHRGGKADKVFLQEVGWAIACLNHIGGVMRDISQFLLLSCFSSWDVVPVR
ncbi:hypothetical protein PRNP1_012691 [Phytophthora ramorum]